MSNLVKALYEMSENLLSVGNLTWGEYPTYQDIAKAVSEGRVTHSRENFNGSYQDRIVIVSNNPAQSWTLITNTSLKGK